MRAIQSQGSTVSDIAFSAPAEHRRYRSGRCCHGSMTRLAALITVLVLTTVACAGDSTDSGPTTTTTTNAALAPTSTTGAPTTAAPQQRHPQQRHPQQRHPQPRTRRQPTLRQHPKHQPRPRPPCQAQRQSKRLRSKWPPSMCSTVSRHRSRDVPSTPTTVWHQFESTSFGSTLPTMSAARRSLLFKRSVPAGSRSSQRSCLRYAEVNMCC